jgi:hypothetical protein
MKNRMNPLVSVIDVNISFDVFGILEERPTTSINFIHLTNLIRKSIFAALIVIITGNFLIKYIITVLVKSSLCILLKIISIYHRHTHEIQMTILNNS